MYRIVWTYEVKPDSAEAFERIYGRDGEWARLFRAADGYLGTDLFRSTAAPTRYVTVDDWTSQAAYEAFRARAAQAYAELDARCDALTLAERLVSAGAVDAV
ncbi:MAG: antibiotic biosynthesis monooxygenase family protein [Gemmatimonadales bacterium]